MRILKEFLNLSIRTLPCKIRLSPDVVQKPKQCLGRSRIRSKTSFKSRRQTEFDCNVTGSTVVLQIFDKVFMGCYGWWNLWPRRFQAASRAGVLLCNGQKCYSWAIQNEEGNFRKKYLDWQAVCTWKSKSFDTTGTIDKKIYQKECPHLLHLAVFHQKPHR